MKLGKDKSKTQATKLQKDEKKLSLAEQTEVNEITKCAKTLSDFCEKRKGYCLDCPLATATQMCTRQTPREWKVKS